MAAPKSLKDLIQKNSAAMTAAAPSAPTPTVELTAEAEVFVESVLPIQYPTFDVEAERASLVESMRAELYEEVREELMNNLRESVIAELRENLANEIKEGLRTDIAASLFERVDQSNNSLLEAVYFLAQKVETLQESLKLEIPTPQINVTIPQRKIVRTVTRDENGLISGFEDQTEE